MSSHYGMECYLHVFLEEQGFRSPKVGKNFALSTISTKNKLKHLQYMYLGSLRSLVFVMLWVHYILQKWTKLLGHIVLITGHFYIMQIDNFYHSKICPFLVFHKDSLKIPIGTFLASKRRFFLAMVQYQFNTSGGGGVFPWPKTDITQKVHYINIS